jgi:hypothetical protein
MKEAAVGICGRCSEWKKSGGEPPHSKMVAPESALSAQSRAGEILARNAGSGELADGAGMAQA